MSRPLKSEWKPLVSVLSPALDSSKYIEEMIVSVEKQDYPAIEHIVLTAGSSDDTESILAGHLPGIKVVADGPVLLSPKLNHGLRLATGEVVAWLNPDDLFLPGAVQAAVDALSREPSAGMVYADMIEIDKSGQQLQKIDCRDFALEKQINEGNLVSQPTVFARRRLLLEVGGFNERYRYAQDYELWIRVGKRSLVQHVTGYWAAYRRHDEQQTATNKDRVGAEIRRASRSHGGRFLSEVGYQHSRSLRIARLIRQGQWRHLLGRVTRRDSAH